MSTESQHMLVRFSTYLNLKMSVIHQAEPRQTTDESFSSISFPPPHHHHSHLLFGFLQYRVSA